MSSTIIRMVSFSVVSLIAIVPDSECKTPILIVPCVWALAVALAIASAVANSAARHVPCKTFMAPSFIDCAASMAARPQSKIKAKPRERFATFAAKARFLGMPIF